MVRVSVVVMPALLVTITVMLLAPVKSCTGKLKLPSGLTWTVTSAPAGSPFGVILMVTDLIPLISATLPLMFWVTSVVVAFYQAAAVAEQGDCGPCNVGAFAVRRHRAAAAAISVVGYAVAGCQLHHRRLGAGTAINKRHIRGAVRGKRG